MEIVGKIIQILPIQQGTSQRTGNTWMLQSFVIETQEQFARKVCIEMFGEDKIKANPIYVDEIVTVFFDLESREYNGRWFTSARAWKVQEGTVSVTDPVAASAAQPAAAPAPAVATANTQTFEVASQQSAVDDGTDLPF